jgi:hypothetical protein
MILQYKITKTSEIQVVKEYKYKHIAIHEHYNSFIMCKILMKYYWLINILTTY